MVSAAPCEPAQGKWFDDGGSFEQLVHDSHFRSFYNKISNFIFDTILMSFKVTLLKWYWLPSDLKKSTALSVQTFY